MSVSAADIASVRRMVAELDATIYTNNDISMIIEKYPCLDERGEEPYYFEGAIPTRVENEDWIPTYDLNRAAAEIWEQKAALLAGKFDFSADGGNYSRSQAYQQALGMSRYYLGRAKLTTIKQIKSPEETDVSSSWIGNLAEGDE